MVVAAAAAAEAVATPALRQPRIPGILAPTVAAVEVDAAVAVVEVEVVAAVAATAEEAAVVVAVMAAVVAVDSHEVYVDGVIWTMHTFLCWARRSRELDSALRWYGSDGFEKYIEDICL